MTDTPGINALPDIPERELLTRKQASAYLAKRGMPITTQKLERLALTINKGKGPNYYRYGWNTVRYVKADLDAWAATNVVRAG